jgi:thiamine transport system substrate-binding protein
VLLIAAAILSACAGNRPADAPTSVPTVAAPTPALDLTAVPTAAPAPTAVPAPAGGKAELVLMTHDSFAVSKEVIAEFEQREGVKVTVLPAGDAGAALNKAILSKDALLADLLFGVDNTFLSRALAAGIFEPYQSPALASIPERFRLDPSAQLLPVDYGYVSINYDKAFLQKNGLTPPTTLRELTKPEWKGLLVVENPATSSPGLAFLLATIAEFGTDGAYSYLDFWRDLRANDVLVVEGWTEAYSTQFSAASGKGPRPLVVSYATSPAAEVFFSDGKLSEPPTGNLNAGSFLQIEFIGILKGTKQRALAERFVDYLLSKRFQEDIPLQMFVYPVLPEAALPDVFTKFAPVPDAIANITAQQIGQNREAWIEAWTKVVLR